MKKIAIIGSGISGLSTAFHLHKNYDVTVYEASETFGGHTDTHSLDLDGKTHEVDSGFIVFCREYYPHFCSMLDSLNVESKETDMSFAMWNKVSNIYYNATTLNSLFCQRKNLFNLGFYRMVGDIIRFYNRAPAVLKQNDHTMSVKEYLEENGYSKQFTHDHLFPMISALWSANAQRVEQFPIRHLVEFMHKHGMMKLIFRPQWRVVKNGSSSYIKALQEQIKCNWKIATPVTSVKRDDSGVVITSSTNGVTHSQNYDGVVFATHSDQALSLLEQVSSDEQEILSNIEFERNHVVVHSDESILHPNRAAWASWNTEVPKDMQEDECCTATYWMNLLQGIDSSKDVFVSLNPKHNIDTKKIYKERIYHHPIFTAQSVAAQKKRSTINGKHKTYYVGAYWGWGFHEDGARSAYEAAQLIKEQL